MIFLSKRSMRVGSKQSKPVSRVAQLQGLGFISQAFFQTMTIHLITTQGEKFELIASIFRRHNIKIHFHPVLEKQNDNRAKRILLEAKKLHISKSSKVLILFSPVDQIARMGIYHSKRDDFSWSETTGVRCLEKICSEYILRFHSSAIEDLSCRSDVFTLRSYRTKTGSVSFEADPRQWITFSPYFQKLSQELYVRLLNFVLNKRGMFPKVWTLESQKNYWNSTLFTVKEIH